MNLRTSTSSRRVACTALAALGALGVGGEIVLIRVAIESSASAPELAARSAALLLFLGGLVGGVLRLARLAGAHRPTVQSDVAALERAALTDSLTGLRNHRAFHEDLKREIARRNRIGTPFSLLMIDLNRLKQINDTLGHQVGDERIRAVAEAIRTGDRAGVRLQVSHLVPRNGIEESRRCIDLVETAQGRGQDVAFDMHTRTFGLTNLYAALPAWALGADKQELEAILGDAARRGAMRTHRSILSAGNDWSRVVLLDSEAWPDYGRRDLASIADERGQDPLDAVYDLLLGGLDELEKLMVIIHAYSEEQQREAFAHPLCVPGSDATTLAPDGRLAHAFFHGAYTWAAWFWRFMVRDEGLLTAEDAIHRLTAQPAERIGLSDRGVLREGARADVVVFDPTRFGERGTVYEPNLLAEGMRHVVVNGVPTLRDGRLTGERAGIVVRR